MTPQDLQSLVDYHDWSRDRILAAVEALSPEMFTRDLGSSFRSVRDTLAHLLGAEVIWLSRFRGAAPAGALPLDRFHDLAAVRTAWVETERDLRAFVADLDESDVARTLTYRLLNGQTGASRIGDMVQHLVNHGTCHRGQVTTMLRQVGAAPPASMDLIAYWRERDAAR